LIQIGTGQGLLPAPVEREQILLGPAQRVDVVVDFRGLLDERVELESVPRSSTEIGTGSLSAPIMQFRVVRDSRDRSKVPNHLRMLPKWVDRAPEMPDRLWTFGLGPDPDGETAWTINGQTFDPERIDADVERGSVETWDLVNTTTNVSHLVHMHGVPFVLLERNGQTPADWERALDDTFRIDPGERLSVAAKFTDYTGTYVLHCHMLEHEDHGMMAQFRVVP
jgi:FtsP/CotA-like multicopper oxidase with cupredoxin domain